MTCPACVGDVTPADLRIDGTIGVCPTCARSVVLDADALRTATSADLAGLTPAQITQLRQARPKAWRDDVRARHARIMGGR